MPVTRKLQTKDSDIAQSIGLINSLKLTIEKLRKNSIFVTRTKIVLQVGLHPNLILLNLKWLFQEFVPSKSIMKWNLLEYNGKYFCVIVTVPLLDHLMPDLEMRFQGDRLTAYFGIHNIP